MIIPAKTLAKSRSVLPYSVSLLLIPVTWYGAHTGGWQVLLLPIIAWYFFSLLDALGGLNLDDGDLNASEDDLFWYRALTLIWVPLQFTTLFGMIWYASLAEHLSTLEKIALFFSMGVISGTIGINYSHELMHQQSKLERWSADLLLAMVVYSHFRSEHLLVHHRYVGTARDPVTARYNEGFHRFFPRVLKQSLVSAFKAERDMLARKGRSWRSPQNPFFRYWLLQATMLGLAFALGGWSGLGLFVLQASVAIWQLELVNYVEHYGLTREHLGEGKYEHVKPRHSWNAAHKFSNWLLINLQRHSDHHYKPDRRFPLLQNYGPDEAPQLPYGYPVMTIAAMIPSLWRNIMNPKVRAWRAQHYPEITDWTAYNRGTNPLPR